MKNTSTHQTLTGRMKKYRQQNKDVSVSNRNIEFLDQLCTVFANELGIVKMSRSGVANLLIERAAHTKLGLAAAADDGKSESEVKTSSAINVPGAQTPVTGDTSEDKADGAVTGDGEAEGLAPAPSVTRNALVDQPAPTSPGNGDGDGTPSQNLTSFKGGRIITNAATITVAFDGPDNRRFAIKASGFAYDGATQSWSRKFSADASSAQLLRILTQYLTEPSDQNLARLQAAVSAP